MSIRSKILTGLAATALSAVAFSSVFAGEIKPYEQGAFEAAQKAGDAIVVDITASWCPTCRAQKPIIQALTTSSDLEPVTVFEVNFDDQKDVVRALGANMQSTLIAFNGETETGRSVGDTKPQSIENLFKSTLSAKP